jgi:tRNA A37 N6-isopentenylltransferase MiaA
MSVVHAEHPVGAARWPARRLWVDRPDLDARIDARVLQMVEQGYVAEVEALLTRGVSRELKPMRSLGYRWMCACVAGEMPLSEAIEGTQRDTRRFAKKQRQMLRSIGGFEPVNADDLDAVLTIAADTFGPA